MLRQHHVALTCSCDAGEGPGQESCTGAARCPSCAAWDKGGCGRGQGPRKREEHHEVGSMVDSTSYYDPTGPLDNVHGYQQTLDFNTPLERPVEPDEWSSE